MLTLPRSTVCVHALGMQCTMQEYNPTLIASYLEKLTPARARITWATRRHDADINASESNAPAAAAAAATPSCEYAGVSLPPPVLTSEPIYGTRYEVRCCPRSHHSTTSPTLLW